MADRSRSKPSPIYDLGLLNCSDSTKSRGGLSGETNDFPRRLIRQRPFGLKSKNSSRERLMTSAIVGWYPRGHNSVRSTQHERVPVGPGQPLHLLSASADDTAATQILGDPPYAVPVVACGRRRQQIALLVEPWHCHMSSRSPVVVSY